MLDELEDCEVVESDERLEVLADVEVLEELDDCEVVEALDKLDGCANVDELELELTDDCDVEELVTPCTVEDVEDDVVSACDVVVLLEELETDD